MLFLFKSWPLVEAYSRRVVADAPQRGAAVAVPAAAAAGAAPAAPLLHRRRAPQYLLSGKLANKL